MANHVTYKLNNYLKDCYSILDICCGNGIVSSGLIYNNITGMDICDEYLQSYKNIVPRSKILKFDISAYMNKSLEERKNILLSKSYDIVMCIDGVEHFEKELSEIFIQDMERIAREKVIIFTPENAINPKLIVPNFPKNVWGTEKGDIFQIHKSAHCREEFIQRNYSTELMGKYKNPYEDSYYYEMLYIKELK
jgi:hypothetical protein